MKLEGLPAIAVAVVLCATSAAFAAATQIAMVSGNGQAATVGKPLAAPFVVVVKDGAGVPVAGFSVTFAVTAGGGTLSATTVSTNASGQAQTTLTVGRNPGTNRVTATATGLTGSPVTFTATANALTYTLDVKAIFNKCIVCHAPGKSQAGQPLDTYSAIVNGTTKLGYTPAKYVTMGNLSQSLISAKIHGTAAGSNMASFAGLTAAEITKIDDWIVQGARNGPPTQIARTSGDAQTAATDVTLPLPLVVTVKDAAGLPVFGVSVAFAVTAGGGSVSAAAATTNASGQASVKLTLGRTAGANTVNATVAGLTGSPVTFTATARLPLTYTANTKAIFDTKCMTCHAPGKSQAAAPLDTYANIVGASTRYGYTPARYVVPGSPTASLIVAKIKGLAAGGNMGTFGGLTPAEILTITNWVADGGRYGTPSALTLTSGNNQSGNAGTSLVASFVVTVKDASGFAVYGHPVTFAVTAGGGILNQGRVLTNAAGQASSRLTLGATPGTNTVTATSPGVTNSPITFTATGNNGSPPTSISLTSGNNQSAVVNTVLPAPFVVTVKNAAGLPCQGVSVVFSATKGGGRLSATTVITDAAGQAKTTLTLGATPGPNTVTCTKAGLTGSPVTFTATAREPFTGGVLAGSTNPLDVAALDALRAAQINPVALSSDAEFLRRVTIALAGRPPPAPARSAYMASPAPTTRPPPLDALLASNDFATHWGKEMLGPWTQTPAIVNKQDANGNVIATYDYDAAVVADLNADKPLGDFVKLLASGTGTEGMAFDTSLRMGPTEAADRILHAFTGMSSKCARCHDHPLTTAADDPRWLQDDNYGLYAFFATTNAQATKVDKAGKPFGSPVQPRFVADGYASAPAGMPLLSDPLATRRARFGDVFVASKAFARGTAHRIWAEISAPLLDENEFLQANLAAVKAPKVLEALATVFRSQNTSLKGFLRVCTNSRLYQLTTAGTTTANDKILARHVVRRNHGEVVNRAVYQVAGIPFVNLSSVFTLNFGCPPTLRDSLEARRDTVSLEQALVQLNSASSSPGLVTLSQSRIPALATQVDNGTITYQAAVTTIVRAALQRDPTAAELTAANTVKSGAASTKAALEDVAAAVCASAEFLMR